LGRVCMALLGDRDAAEKALERVAREAGGKPEERTLVTLLGLARIACATQLSKLPLKKDEAPTTERIGAVEDAANARATLGSLKPTEREAIVLHLVGGLDVADVAKACNVDEQTARQRIARGMSQLVEEEGKR
jgi:DNA-directed RNA polymerase specialized sigma24 family protein